MGFGRAKMEYHSAAALMAVPTSIDKPKMGLVLPVKENMRCHLGIAKDMAATN